MNEKLFKMSNLTNPVEVIVGIKGMEHGNPLGFVIGEEGVLFSQEHSLIDLQIAVAYLRDLADALETKLTSKKVSA